MGTRDGDNVDGGRRRRHPRNETRTSAPLAHRSAARARFNAGCRDSPAAEGTSANLRKENHPVRTEDQRAQAHTCSRGLQKHAGKNRTWCLESLCGECGLTREADLRRLFSRVAVENAGEAHQSF